MKQLKIQIPDWVEKERSIKVFAGNEPVAYMPNTKGPLYIKTIPCNLCGRCCIIERKESAPFKTKRMKLHGKTETVCEFLEKEKREVNGKVITVYVCTQAGPLVPWGCNTVHLRNAHKKCTIKWKEVKK